MEDFLNATYIGAGLAAILGFFGVQLATQGRSRGLFFVPLVVSFLCFLSVPVMTSITGISPSDFLTQVIGDPIARQLGFEPKTQRSGEVVETERSSQDIATENWWSVSGAAGKFGQTGDLIGTFSNPEFSASCLVYSPNVSLVFQSDAPKTQDLLATLQLKLGVTYDVFFNFLNGRVVRLPMLASPYQPEDPNLLFTAIDDTASDDQIRLIEQIIELAVFQEIPFSIGVTDGNRIYADRTLVQTEGGLDAWKAAHANRNVSREVVLRTKICPHKF